MMEYIIQKLVYIIGIISPVEVEVHEVSVCNRVSVLIRYLIFFGIGSPISRNTDYIPFPRSTLKAEILDFPFIQVHDFRVREREDARIK